MNFKLNGTALVLSLLAVSCGSTNTEKIAGKSVRAKVETVRAVDIPQTYIFSGSIQGHRRSVISTKIMGQVLSVDVDAGDRVSEGQPLMKIKSDDLDAKKSQVKANKIEAQAALKNVEINYNRMKELFASKSATQKEMDDIEAAYTMANARVRAIEEMEKEVDDAISYSDILSPFNGSVVQKMTEVGNTAAPGMPLLMVEDMSSIKVVLNVPETEIHLFTKNASIKVDIDAADIHTTASVTQISPSGRPGSRQYEVQADLKSPTSADRDRIRSGMFARATISNGVRKMIAVPDSLILKRGQLEGIYTVIPGDLTVLRWIRTGRTTDGRVEILSGLAEGDRVITSSESQLSDGVKIEVAL